MNTKLNIFNDRIVIIIAVGRSAGTTLMRVLNTIPNTNICGENKGAIFSLLHSYYALKNMCNQQKSAEEVLELGFKPAFHNVYKINEIRVQTKALIINILKKDGCNIWGFKEIRFKKDNIHLINTFRELFPQTKVIFNYSTDIERQSHSAWFNKWDSKEELLERNSILKEHYEENKDFIYLNTMQKTISGDLYDLFKFIDCEKYYNTDKIRYILNDNYNDPNHKYYHLNNIYT